MRSAMQDVDLDVMLAAIFASEQEGTPAAIGLTERQEAELIERGHRPVTEADRDALDLDDPLSVLSWMVEQRVAVHAQPIPNLFTETHGPIIFDALERLLRVEIENITPVERVGRIFTVDVKPKGLPDPRVMFMIPQEQALAQAWHTYSHAIGHYLAWLVHGDERVRPTSRVRIDVWGGSLVRDRYVEHLDHSPKARRGLSEALRQFIDGAPDALTVQELAHLLSAITGIKNGLGG